MAKSLTQDNQRRVRIDWKQDPPAVNGCGLGFALIISCSDCGQQESCPVRGASPVNSYVKELARPIKHD
ncbi:MAG: hypothetical protein UT31_C0014G0005 [Parcubacteria group bacterium GW2011_GWF2_39_13b]|nr:MAG: hypothetical protein UT31_C0014G0005 [Parcubacteria group bacterium GW2011_GWF2_39_13b]